MKNYRTRIRIQIPKTVKEKGKLDETKVWIDLGNKTENDKPQYKYCEWTNAHGTDYLIADTLSTKERPTIKLRYDPRINPKCRVLKDDDEKPYKIIGIPDNVKDKNQEMEIKLERVINA